MGRKVSDGQSVRVTIPVSTVVSTGQFRLFSGWFGMVIQTVTTGGSETADIILDIEQCEYETSQITVADAFAKGDLVYWVTGTSLLTTTASTNRLVGRVTVAKDSNNVIWMLLGSQV